jgi:hypothetical protein
LQGVWAGTPLLEEGAEEGGARLEVDPVPEEGREVSWDVVNDDDDEARLLAAEETWLTAREELPVPAEAPPLLLWPPTSATQPPVPVSQE